MGSTSFCLKINLLFAMTAVISFSSSDFRSRDTTIYTLTPIKPTRIVSIIKFEVYLVSRTRFVKATGLAIWIGTHLSKNLRRKYITLPETRLAETLLAIGRTLANIEKFLSLFLNMKRRTIVSTILPTENEKPRAQEENLSPFIRIKSKMIIQLSPITEISTGVFVSCSA